MAVSAQLDVQEVAAYKQRMCHILHMAIATRSALLRKWAILLALVMVGAAGSIAAARWVDTASLGEANGDALQSAEIHAGLLTSELQKFRLLPLVLSEYPGIQALVSRPTSDPQRVNEQLSVFAERTGAAVIYVIRSDGRTLAASNWAEPTSFVGQDYGFRPYFTQALARGEAEMFGLGTISGRPGLFIARQVEGNGGALGVIVVKVEFDAVEAQWAQQSGPTFVTDQRGVILITSRPEWRFRTIGLLSADTRDAIRRSNQFGDHPLDPLPITVEKGLTRLRGSGDAYRMAREPVPLAGAELYYLQPVQFARARAVATVRFVILSVLALSALAFAWFWRANVRRRALEEARDALEFEVADRTSALRDANTQLVAESDRRKIADKRFRDAREELAHANRIGSIGQITAGVTHEINQPVAAIQTFAANARKFIDRGSYGSANDNLIQIVQLTERIGKITGELRGYARRGTPAIGRVELEAVFTGALLLVGDRMASAGVVLDRRGDTSGIVVMADRIRLEQVLINLIQNAIDATAGTTDARIMLSVATGKDVTITVADNGPGIPPDIADAVFTPFVTGKPSGLGLGLGIARDIVRDFGGRLEVIDSPLGGAAFAIYLRPGE